MILGRIVVGCDAVPVKCSLVGRRHRPDNVNCSGITFMALDAFIMVAKKCYSSYAGCVLQPVLFFPFLFFFLLVLQ